MGSSEKAQVLLALIIAFHIEPAAKVAMALPFPNALSNDIDMCLFRHWRTSDYPILESRLDCRGGHRFGLCYFKRSDLSFPAQFAACYNTNKFIPEFTANVVGERGALYVKTGLQYSFRQDRGYYGKRTAKRQNLQV